MIEEEDDEDKNNQKNKNINKNLDISPENNIKNEHDFIDSKYSYINSYANNSQKNHKDTANNNTNNEKNNILSMINNNNQDKKLILLFESKKNNMNDKISTTKWNQSSNRKNFETDIFNKITKDSRLGQKIFKESNIEKNLHLPNIKSQNLYNRKNPSNKINLESINDMKNINILSNKMLNMNSNNYINDNTQATTLITYSTKKFSSSKINTNMKSMNNDLTQFGMGLISAGSTTNNNIIIPILTKARPESNFNCGGGILKNFNDNFDNNGKIKTVESDKNLHNKSRNFRKKICKSQEVQKRINASMKNKEIHRVFPDLQRIIPTFHKIKIEKGMTNIKF